MLQKQGENRAKMPFSDVFEYQMPLFWRVSLVLRQAARARARARVVALFALNRSSISVVHPVDD